MESLHLHLDSIKISQDATLDRIGGTIYFSVGNVCFPDEGWYDLVSVDLERWLPSIISFAFNHTDFCDLVFMDGPAQIHFSRREGGVIAVCTYGGRVEVPETEIDFTELIQSVLKTIRRYNRLLQEQGVASQFKNELNLLKEAISINEEL